jgi:hypothetical protein
MAVKLLPQCTSIVKLKIVAMLGRVLNKLIHEGELIINWSRKTAILNGLCGVRAHTTQRFQQSSPYN